MFATMPKGSMGQYSICCERPESKMPRPDSEALLWRASWMKEFLGYSVDEVAVCADLC